MTRFAMTVCPGRSMVSLLLFLINLEHGTRCHAGADRGGEANAPADSPRAQVDALIGDVGRLKREDQLRRWREISNLCVASPEAAGRLREIAIEKDSGCPEDRYRRFVAAANSAGFGEPTGIGPNSLMEGNTLGWYVDLHRKTGYISIKRHLFIKKIACDARISNLAVVIPRNEKNDLKFQEILWQVLEKYDLNFRTEPDGTFFITKRGPLL